MVELVDSIGFVTAVARNRDELILAETPAASTRESAGQNEGRPVASCISQGRSIELFRCEHVLFFKKRR